MLLAVYLGVVRPALGARSRVERDDLAEGGAEVDRAVEEDGRGLEGQLLRRPAVLAEFAGPVGPGRLEAADVVAVDLVERGIARAAGIAAVGVPAARFRLLLCSWMVLCLRSRLTSARNQDESE